MRFQTGYMDRGLFNLISVIADAHRDLGSGDVDFDTLVGTGFSGGVVIPTLAMELGKNYLLIRKPNDDSHHSGRLIGELGSRWIFVDDFIGTGATKDRVTNAVRDAVTRQRYPWEGEGEATTYVGDYLYARDRWRPAMEEVTFTPPPGSERQSKHWSEPW